MNYTAAQRRFFENVALIGAQRILFARLADTGTPVFKLSDLAETTSGGTPDRSESAYYGGSIPWMKSGELTDGLVTEIEETITERGLANSNAKVFPVGTLLIALYGATVGKTGILGIEAATNQAVCAVVPKRKDVRGRYLYWFLRRKREDFLQTSFGGAQPNISQKILRDTVVPLPPPTTQDALATFLEAVEKRMRDKSIPLPQLPAPLAEQRRIVAQIEELAAQIHEARTLRHQAAEEAEVLLFNQIGKAFSGLGTKHKPREFGSFAPHVTSGPRNWAKHYEQNGPRFYRAQDIGPAGNILDGSKVFITPPPGEQGRTAMLQDGDLMLVITGATVGRVSVYRKELEPGFVSQHVGICRLPQREVDPEFALWGLRGPTGQSQLLGQRYGQGKPGLNLANIRWLSLPFPPLPEQRRIVAELDALQAEVDALKRLQSETAAELDALLPAILDRAFKGEL